MPANPLPCGCSVHCPLHQAAADMLEALKEHAHHVPDGLCWCFKFYQDYGIHSPQCQSARAAIARAEKVEAKP